VPTHKFAKDMRFQERSFLIVPAILCRHSGIKPGSAAPVLGPSGLAPAFTRSGAKA
jgi:hypothetical protein